MKKKTIIFSIIGVIALAGGIYGYNEYTRVKKDLKNVKASLSVSSDEIIKAFEEDEAAANKKFLPKNDFIIEVSGVVKEVKKDSKGNYTVVLEGAAGSMSSVQCAADPGHAEKMANLKEGDPVKIKGVITGFNKDELLGSDVFLSRSVLSGN